MLACVRAWPPEELAIDTREPLPQSCVTLQERSGVRHRQSQTANRDIDPKARTAGRRSRMWRGRAYLMFLKNVLFWGSCLLMIGLLIALFRILT